MSDATLQEKCKHCGKPRGLHSAKSGGCPFGLKHRTVGYINFHADQVFAPKLDAAKDEPKHRAPGGA